jgi:diguanylate cyclase (GGDEF)-like protein
VDENRKLKKKIADLESKLHKLEKNSIYDSLTSLKTRAYFEDDSKVYLSAINATDGKRKEKFGFKSLSFLFCDIDNFKNINDTYGHPAGDAVLADVAQAIAQSVREGDTVARWGGEEIVVSLLGANEADAKLKAEDIRGKIEELSFVSVPGLKVTISIGVATNFPDSNYDSILKNADLALYEAKRTGKNKVVAFSQLNNK